MSKQFTLKHLTEGTSLPSVANETNRLVGKWEESGLLKNLNGYQKESMARLLENQARELLRESNALSTGAGAMTSSGQIRGFTTVAFPIVRRVFGGLVANELVSIQPMSLPAGLLFYLDYTYGNMVAGGTDVSADVAGGTDDSDDSYIYKTGQSLYGGPAGKEVAKGAYTTGGQYDLVGTAFTRVHTSSAPDAIEFGHAVDDVWAGAWTDATVGNEFGWEELDNAGNGFVSKDVVATLGSWEGNNSKFVDYDQLLEGDLEEGLIRYFFAFVPVSVIKAQFPLNVRNAIDFGSLEQITIYSFDSNANRGDIRVWGSKYQGGRTYCLNKYTQRGTFDSATGEWTPDPFDGEDLRFVLALKATGADGAITTGYGAGAAFGVNVVLTSAYDVDTTDGSTLTIPSFESDFGVSPEPVIPEIDIHVESVSVRAKTRKLRTRWTPEFAQDLNAYHSIDAEVELTQILSEQIALDIDREILYDLVKEAKGANFFWSRAPGKFVNKRTGRYVYLDSALSTGPSFLGTPREWYETLIEVIIDAANQIHKKTLRGSANFIVTSPDVCTVLEASQHWHPAYTIDNQGQVSNQFTLGAELAGTVANRFTVYKDPYFPANKILLGFKGGSYLETGYVYAPYVPLIVTPTIFAPEDFTPRKGVMTRYGKKMVRADFFATVVCRDMNVI